jgi:hypothetical protein
MIRIGLLFSFAYFAPMGCLYLMAASEIDGSKPYGSVCLSVLDETASGLKEVPFSPEVVPGPGKTIIAHAVANAPCFLLVVAFNRNDGQLAYNWRPQFAELAAEWTEVALPEKGPMWKWETKAKPFDIYVLFSTPGSPLAKEIKALVTAMQSPNERENLVKLQTNKLRGLVSSAAGDADLLTRRATADVAEVGGIARGSDAFSWRQFTVKVNFDDRDPGLLIFSSGT